MFYFFTYPLSSFFTSSVSCLISSSIISIHPFCFSLFFVSSFLTFSSFFTYSHSSFALSYPLLFNSSFCLLCSFFLLLSYSSIRFLFPSPLSSLSLSLSSVHSFYLSPIHPHCSFFPLHLLFYISFCLLCLFALRLSASLLLERGRREFSESPIQTRHPFSLRRLQC